MSSTTSGNTLPCWLVDQTVPKFDSLQADTQTDIIIVGAGIAGLTCAYQLLKRNYKVVVLEDGEIASGESGRTTAHLASGIDDRYFEVEAQHGTENAKLVGESHCAAIDLIEQIIQEEGIECDFQRCPGYLFLSDTHLKTKPELLNREFSVAHMLGLSVEMLDKTPSFKVDSASLKFNNQACFHPVKYLSALAKAIEKLGGQIFTNSHATKMEGGDSTAKASANGHTVHGTHLIVATNTPVNDRVVMHTKLEPYRSYVITCFVEKGAINPALYWDTDDPYHYVRVAPTEADEFDLVIIGGEDHKVGQAHDYDKRFENLYNWAIDKLPIATAYGIIDKWSGQIIEPVDSLAYIGRNPADYKNVYIITGDSGNGMTHGTMSGIIIPDLIQGKENPWARIYDPSRRPPVKDIGQFLQHNLNVQLQYRQWVTPGEVSDIEDIKPCSGAILRRGLTKEAVYKDEHGNVTVCSAVCPHLEAIVSWNSLEKTWDCPAHGSRYDRYGTVLNGPSNFSLTRKDLKTESATATTTTSTTLPSKEEIQPPTTQVPLSTASDRS